MKFQERIHTVWVVSLYHQNQVVISLEVGKETDTSSWILEIILSPSRRSTFNNTDSEEMPRVYSLWAQPQLGPHPGSGYRDVEVEVCSEFLLFILSLYQKCLLKVPIVRGLLLQDVKQYCVPILKTQICLLSHPSSCLFTICFHRTMKKSHWCQRDMHENRQKILARMTLKPEAVAIIPMMRR